MKDTLFLQFYNQIRGAYFDLCNGFSDTYELCKSKGDFYWTAHEVDRGKWYEEQTYAQRDLPISSGTVYISAIYANHLYQSYVWAERYPNIHFIVGGPVAAERQTDRPGWKPLYLRVDPSVDWPPNLTVTGKSVEDWFGVPNFSGKWQLHIPEEVPKDSTVYFSYTLDNGCYWRKCIYCNIALHAGDRFRKRERFDFEFKKITHTGTRIVRLNTGSITPKFIRDVLPLLPRENGLEYRLFIRSGAPENIALERVLGEMNGRVPNMVLGFGMEFPSNRMLKYAGKGFTTDDLLEFLRICASRGVPTNANFMLGWNNLVQDDLRELETFLGQIPENSVTTAQVRWLLAHPFTEIHDTYLGEAIRLGPFYEGFRVEVDERQKELNRQARDLLKHYSKVKNFKVAGLVSIKKHL